MRAGCGSVARCCWIAGQSLVSQTGGTTNLVGQARLVSCQNRKSDRQCGSKFAFESIQSSVWVIIQTQIGPSTATGGERREMFPQTFLVQPQRIFVRRSTDPGATTNVHGQFGTHPCSHVQNRNRGTRSQRHGTSLPHVCKANRGHPDGAQFQWSGQATTTSTVGSGGRRTVNSCVELDPNLCGNPETNELLRKHDSNKRCWSSDHGETTPANI